MGCARRPTAIERRSSHRSARWPASTCPAGRGRKRFLAPGAQALRGHGRLGHLPASLADRHEQPEQPHRITLGGSSWSRTFTGSARPSVSSARRVSPGRPTGSADHALPLISIQPCATSVPRVISQRQPRASAPARTCRPRLALICQPISARLRHRTLRRAGRARRPQRAEPRPARRHGSPARRHTGSPQVRSQSVTQPGRRRAQVAVLAQRGGCDLDNVGLTDVGDLRGPASRTILRRGAG
jgi:hypothetical protein